MSLNRKLHTFFSLTGGQQLMVVEGVLVLGIARFLVALFPFKVYERSLGNAGAPLPDPNDKRMTVANEVRGSIAIASRNVPWNAV